MHHAYVVALLPPAVILISNVLHAGYVCKDVWKYCGSEVATTGGSGERMEIAQLCHSQMQTANCEPCSSRYCKHCACLSGLKWSAIPDLQVLNVRSNVCVYSCCCEQTGIGTMPEPSTDTPASI